jgi:hypothetical protein
MVIACAQELCGYVEARGTPLWLLLSLSAIARFRGFEQPQYPLARPLTVLPHLLCRNGLFLHACG